MYSPLMSGAIDCTGWRGNGVQPNGVQPGTPVEKARAIPYRVPAKLVYSPGRQRRQHGLAGDRTDRMVTERELIQRCREGDREAQREAYDRTCGQIYRLLSRMTGNEDDASDLTQETYLRAFSRIRGFDGRSSFATWLYRIAFNEALQFLRGADKRRSNSPLVAAADHAESAQHNTTTRLDVNAALSSLKPTDRGILLLRYQEGLDYRSIAETIGTTEGTVASRLNRARSRLREMLRKSYGMPEGANSAQHPKGVAKASVKGGLDTD